MTGAGTWKTTTDITTDHTASEVRGTGAVTTTLGTGIHGHIPLGAITDGTIRSIWEDGMTHGTMEDTMEDTGDGATGTDITTTILHITQVTIMVLSQVTEDLPLHLTAKVRDMRQVPTESSQEVLHSEEVQA